MRSTVTIAVAIALLGAAGAGCGADSPGTTEPQEPQTGPLVTYARGGGVAGVDEQLRVERDGEATATVGYNAAPHSFQVGDGELALLESELEAADFEAIEPGPTGCADCFVYEVTYEGRSYTYDQLAEPPQSVLTAVARLDRLAIDNYPAAEEPAPPVG